MYADLEQLLHLFAPTLPCLSACTHPMTHRSALTQLASPSLFPACSVATCVTHHACTLTHPLTPSTPLAGDGPAPSTRRAALDFSAAGPGSTLAPQSQPPAQSPTMVWPTPPAQFTFGGAEDDTSRLVRNISQAVEASGGTVSMGMSPPTFSFGAPQPALQVGCMPCFFQSHSPM